MLTFSSSSISFKSFRIQVNDLLFFIQLPGLLELFSFDFVFLRLGDDWSMLPSYCVEEWTSSAYLLTALFCLLED